MKEPLIDIITKITTDFINYTKIFINKTTNSFEFESSKNDIIKVMYDSILEEKTKEKDKLLLELNNIKKQNLDLDKKINIIKEENALYNKKINALNSFQQFLLDRKD